MTPTNTTTKPLAAYMRVSRIGEREDRLRSFDLQRETIARYAKAEGFRVEWLEPEADVSGSRRARPILDAAIARIRSGELGGIVVAKLDRLARLRPKDRVGLFADVEDAGGVILSASEPLDPSTPQGRFTRDLFLSLARMEWERLAEGFEDVKRAAVEDGLHVAPAPVGLLRPRRGARLKIDPTKSPAIRAAFKLFMTGTATYGDVARLLNEKLPGGPFGTGAWSRSTVSRLLANRCYLGEARGGDGNVQMGAHPALIDVATFDTVQAIARRGHRPGPGNRAKSLLAGVARCGSCGYALDRNKVAKRYMVYRCRAHSASGACEAPTSAMADALDELVTTRVVERLSGHAVERIAVTTDVASLHARIAATRSKREPFEDPEYVAVIGREAAARACRRVDAELDQLEAELAEAAVSATPGAPMVLPTAEVWATFSTDERRELIAAMIDTVTVSRGLNRRVPLADRVEITWRGEAAPVLRPSRGRARRPEVEAGLAAA